MPDIYPTGKLQLYSGIKLDNTYQHALSFASPEARETFFGYVGTGSLMQHNLTARQYQRVNSGVCEVQLPINAVYDINYMRFQNTDFSTRWFYAFVTKVEYVNNQNSRIYYEIDVLTTFYFDWGYLPSFVEREHAATDDPGDNLVEEPVKFREPECFSRDARFFSDFLVCIAASDFTDVSGNRSARISLYGNYESGVFHGVSINACQVVGYDLTNSSAVTQFQQDLSTLSESTADIINIFLFPKILVGSSGPDANAQQQIYFNSYDTSVNRPSTLNGYTPKNNKLFTFPYCYLCVDNGTVTNSYRWEFFQHVAGYSDYQFTVKGLPNPTPNVYIAPINYKGVIVTESGEKYVYEERLDLAPLPQVAFPLDSYKAWVAQTQSSRQHKVIAGAAGGLATGVLGGAKLGTAIGAAGGPIGAGAGAAIGAVAGAVLGAIGAKAAADWSVTEAADMKNKATGPASEISGLADGHWGVIFKKMTLTYDEARIIDSFFDMFGYAQNRVKVPAIRTRDHWNYIKTNGLNMSFTTGIPADYVVKIKAIHDQGVTYWKNHSEIGNYALTNSISV